jgi:hypothetical protein
MRERETGTPVIPGERICPSCGHQLGPLSDGLIYDLEDFGNRAAATIDFLFRDDPLVQPCPNCDSRVPSLAFVVFADVPEGFACGYGPGLEPPDSVEGVQSSDLVWTADLATFRAAISAHVQRVIEHVLLTLSAAVANSSTAEVSRTRLALASI